MNPAERYAQRIREMARHIANYCNTLDDWEWSQVVSEAELIRAERADRRRGRELTAEECQREQALDTLTMWLLQTFRDLSPEGRCEVLDQAEEVAAIERLLGGLEDPEEGRKLEYETGT
jgi:hypothetical protein